MTNSLTITIAEFLEFSESISDDWYFEEDTIPDKLYDGLLPPEDTITINAGDIAIVWQGSEDAPDGNDEKEFISEFMKWKKNRDFNFFVIKVKKTEYDKIKNLLNENGIEFKE